MMTAPIDDQESAPEPAQAPAEPEDGEQRQWYVVHTLSGFEQRVKVTLEERIRALGKQEAFGEVLLPTEKVVELRGGKRRMGQRKFFPGYLLVNMAMSDETWHLVRSIPRVTGFVGGTTPAPIPEEEVQKIVQQIEEGAAHPKPRARFQVGDKIKVVDGPFQDFVGAVEEIKADKNRVRVLISVFGRATPVELDFIQVEKM